MGVREVREARVAGLVLARGFEYLEKAHAGWSAAKLQLRSDE